VFEERALENSQSWFARFHQLGDFLGELGDTAFLEIGQANGVLGQNVAIRCADKPDLQPEGIGRLAEVAKELRLLLRLKKSGIFSSAELELGYDARIL
jgi:hypothetical protein